MDLSVEVFRLRPEPIPVTAKNIGRQLDSDDPDKVAAMLLAWAENVQGRVPVADWSRECQNIVGRLNKRECSTLLSILMELVCSLENRRVALDSKSEKE